jgi:hypothetical protein
LTRDLQGEKGMNQFEILRDIIRTLEKESGVAPQEDVAAVEAFGEEKVAEIESAVQKMRKALQDAHDWLDAFGEHAPIQFGGEAELAETLEEAIASADQLLRATDGASPREDESAGRVRVTA